MCHQVIENKQRNGEIKEASDNLILPPMRKQFEERIKLQRETERKARQEAEAEKEVLGKVLYAKCSEHALNNLKLAEGLRSLIDNDKTFCIVGYIDDPDKAGEKIKVAFFGNDLDYIGLKNAPFNLCAPLDVENKKYQFNLKAFPIKSYIDNSENAGTPISPIDDVDYVLTVKKSFRDKEGQRFLANEEARDKFSLDADTILIQAEPSETYTRFRITKPTVKYSAKGENSLLDGGHVEYFWGTIKTSDGREIKMGEQRIYGAKLLEAKE